MVNPLLSGHLSKCKLCAILNGFSITTRFTLLRPILTFPNEILGVFANIVKLNRGLSLGEPDRRSVCGVHGPYHFPWLGVESASIFSLEETLKLRSGDHIIKQLYASNSARFFEEYSNLTALVLRDRESYILSDATNLLRSSNCPILTKQNPEIIKLPLRVAKCFAVLLFEINVLVYSLNFVSNLTANQKHSLPILINEIDQSGMNTELNALTVLNCNQVSQAHLQSYNEILH